MFWKTHWNQLQLGGSAGYIARRLTSTDDLDALAWGANHLGEYAWTHAAGARGITPYDDASLKILPGRPPHDPGTAPKLPPA